MASVFQGAESHFLQKNRGQAPYTTCKDTKINRSILKARAPSPDIPAPWHEVPQEGMEPATWTCSPCTQAGQRNAASVSHWLFH